MRGTYNQKVVIDESGKGTIFLDEMGDISVRIPTSLLRVPKTGEIRAVGSSKPRSIACRIVIATNADLDALAERNLLRSHKGQAGIPAGMIAKM